MKLLSHNPIQKRNFNPKSSVDLKAYKAFESKWSWGGPCPFFLEWPYSNIPSMIQDKIIKAYLNTLIKLK